MENYYVYNNFSEGYSFKTCGETEVGEYVKSKLISLCSSSFFAEKYENLSNWKNSGTKFRMAKDVYEEINEKISFRTGIYNISNNKENFLFNIDVESTGTTNNIFGNCDNSPIVLASHYNNGIVLCTDPDEAAISLHRGVPYIYKIHQSDLVNFNGLVNYRLEHIKKINNMANILNKKI